MENQNKPYTESDAVSAIDTALTSLPDDDARSRVIDWAVAKYGRVGTRFENARRQDRSGSGDDGARGSDGVNQHFGSRATAWMKKHRLSVEMFDAAFHIDGENSSIILRTIPGKSKRERLPNVAALVGALALIRSDQPKFSAHELRDALKQYDAYDRANNATTIRAFKNIIQGSGTDGYAVTAVGLDLAAGLLRGDARNEE